MTDLQRLGEALKAYDNPPNHTETWEDDRKMGIALGVLADAARRWRRVCDILDSEVTVLMQRQIRGWQPRSEISKDGRHGHR